MARVNGKNGVGRPAQRGGYHYRARPDDLSSKPRSDGRGSRHAISCKITDAFDLIILDKTGRRVDGRMRVVRAGQEILTQLVEDLGGPEAITVRQRYQLEIVVRRILVGRELFEQTTVRGDERINPQVGVENDRTLMRAMQDLYR